MESRRESYTRKAAFPGRNLVSMACRGGLAEANEKELLRGLNGRLAGFIEKVRQLELHNHLLEREIQDIREKGRTAGDVEQQRGPELRRLRQLVQDMRLQKMQVEAEQRNLEEELQKVQDRCDKEGSIRCGTERNIAMMKRDVDDAYRAKAQLEKKVKALTEEIDLMKTNHQAEVLEMSEHIRDSQVEVKEFGRRDLTESLRDIRAQLEGREVYDLLQAEEAFRARLAELTKAAEAKREALKATQQEIQEYRRGLQARNIELDCAKGTREALEQQLRQAEEHHSEEILRYQDTIKRLENELINSKFDMSSYLREYQDLMNVKMALDMEILSYRKLLCGEEARLGRASDGVPVSTPYIYHQSPVYALPRPCHQGGPQARAEPQYKFVEEIITETTREIEMLEYEEVETGEGEEEEEEEEGNGEKVERECPKSDGGSGEEDDHKDGGAEEDEQECDGEQDQADEGREDGGEEGERDVNGGEGEEGTETEAGGRKEDEDDQIQGEEGEDTMAEKDMRGDGDTATMRDEAPPPKSEAPQLSGRESEGPSEDRAEEREGETADDNNKGEGEKSAETGAAENAIGSPRASLDGDSASPTRDEEAGEATEDVGRDTNSPPQSSVETQKPNDDNKPTAITSPPESGVTKSREVGGGQQGAPKSS